MKMMTLMMMIRNFLGKSNKGFWPEYLPMHLTFTYATMHIKFTATSECIVSLPLTLKISFEEIIGRREKPSESNNILCVLARL